LMGIFGMSKSWAPLGRWLGQDSGGGLGSRWRI